jgi:hypothetical protein
MIMHRWTIKIIYTHMYIKKTLLGTFYCNYLRITFLW